MAGRRCNSRRRAFACRSAQAEPTDAGQLEGEVERIDAEGQPKHVHLQAFVAGQRQAEQAEQ